VRRERNAGAPQLERFLDEYLAAAGIGDRDKTPLFQDQQRPAGRFRDARARRGAAPDSCSHATRRWREMDSNF
jgi:hypothetical protein